MEQKELEAAVSTGIVKAVGAIALLVFALAVLAYGAYQRANADPLKEQLEAERKASGIPFTPLPPPR